MNLRIEIIGRFAEEGFREVRFLKNPDGRGTVAIASFPVRRQPDADPEGVRIAPFAAADHYAQAVKRLKRISLFIRQSEGLGKRDVRIFCNSTLEEKKFAVLAGLGFIGRNSLVISREIGSRFVLAGMILPLDIEPDLPLDRARIPGALCGGCRSCVEKCPTSAIGRGGVINRDLCLQSLTTSDKKLPPEIMGKWGNRLYGCTICQDCCPFNRNVLPLYDRDFPWHPGETIPFKSVLEPDDVSLKKQLKNSALGMSWIKPEFLKRNALISAAHSDSGSDLLALINRYADNPVIGYAARWAADRIGKEI